LPTFDFDAALRWAKPDRWKQLRRRPASDLHYVGGAAQPGPALLLDSCVYIDQMQDRTPKSVDELIRMRVVNHSSIAIMELMHPVGRLDPSHSGTKDVIGVIRQTIQAMRRHRIFEPDTDVMARAAILSGMLGRLQNYAARDRLRALHDSILFLQAHKHGLALLTRNTGDFDLLLQMVPAGRALFYRREDASP
jgi:hypothetical protein